MSMPRSNSRSSTFRSESGKRTYIMTTSRITSGGELKHRNGEGGLALDLRGMAANYKLPHRSDRARRSHDIEGAGVPDASGGVAPLSRPAVSAASISRDVPEIQITITDPV
jgi:hypothetical protein